MPKTKEIINDTPCMQTMTSYNRHFRAASSLTASKKQKKNTKNQTKKKGGY